MEIKTNMALMNWVNSHNDFVAITALLLLLFIFFFTLGSIDPEG